MTKTELKTDKKPVVYDMDNLDTGLAGETPIEVELLHPATKAPMGMFISVISAASNTFRQYMREKTNDELLQQASPGYKPETPTVEAGEASGIESLVVCTTGWRNITWGGVDFPFTPANARKLYLERGWIRPQIDQATGDLKRFMKA